MVVHISGWTVYSPARHISAALFSSQFPLLPISFSKIRISLRIKTVGNGRLHERYRRSEDTPGLGEVGDTCWMKWHQVRGWRCTEIRGRASGMWETCGPQFKFFFFFFFWPCIVACGTLVPWPGIELMPLNWKHGVLITGLPEKSLLSIWRKKDISKNEISTYSVKVWKPQFSLSDLNAWLDVLRPEPFPTHGASGRWVPFNKDILFPSALSQRLMVLPVRPFGSNCN